MDKELGYCIYLMPEGHENKFELDFEPAGTALEPRGMYSHANGGRPITAPMAWNNARQLLIAIDPNHPEYCPAHKTLAALVDLANYATKGPDRYTSTNPYGKPSIRAALDAIKAATGFAGSYLDVLDTQNAMRRQEVSHD